MVVVGLALLGTVLIGRISTAAPSQEVASVQELKAQAAQAIRDGRFARTNELLSRAAELSHSPSDELAAQWTRHFEDQRNQFDVERQKQCDKATGNVKVLLEKGHLDYAIDAARGAYLLAKDKEAFRHEAWIDKLVNDSIERASKYDQNEQWVKSLRIYSDLAAISRPLPSGRTS